jgi:crotonobetainyl-CoA:carnitine CoA-transferase CaiB-like acyl-CoA transferase
MKYTKRELAERAQSHHLSITSYYDPKELREDPHLNARNYFVDVKHPELETTITYAGAPYGLSETPWSIRRRAPLIGEHNEEVYAGELGYSTEQLALLKAAGAI